MNLYSQEKRRKAPFQHILDMINLPEHLKSFLPKKWKRLGSALVLKIPDELEDYKNEIGKTYAQVLGVHSVFKVTSTIKDEFRRPSLERIYGTTKEVVNIENGVKYCFDVTKIMFSKGNTPERARICKIKMNDEKVLDLFAGIGYFSLPAAKWGGARKVIAVEKNPDAFYYLKKNIALNHLQDKVIPVFGDNRTVPLEKDFDRVFMGYLFRTEEFLPLALKSLSEKGGVVHFHTKLGREEYREKKAKKKLSIEDLSEKFKSVLMESLNSFGLVLLSARLFKVKSYAPGIYHVVFDLKLKRQELYEKETQH